ncbi:MAG: hypothetical protein AB7O68_26160 [Pirellulales bacterium]
MTRRQCLRLGTTVKGLLRPVVILAFSAALWLASAGSAQANPWPLVFPGGTGYRTLADQQFSVAPSISGDVTIAAKVFSLLDVPEQTSPFTSFGWPTVNSHPQSLDSLGTGTLVGLELDEISLIHVDFLNGQAADLGFANVPLTTTESGFAFLDFDATLTALTFQQTGQSTTFEDIFTSGTGTFELPGTLTATLSDILGTIDGFSLLSFADQVYELPVILAGEWHVQGTNFGPEFTLEGIQSLDVPLALATTLLQSFPGNQSVAVSFSLLSTVSLDISYHLETVDILPEPGSVVLLLIGALALAPIAHRYRRRMKPR